MKKKHSGHPVRNRVLVVLLALICIGATELAACSHFAPEVYQKIVAPVRRAAAVTLDVCRAGLDQAGRFCRSVGEQAAHLADDAVLLWQDLTTKEEVMQESLDELSSQQASEPSIASLFPISDPAVTELRETDAGQVLTGGSIDIAYFYQADDTWGDLPYGTDYIGRYGCGPTAMAMAVLSMTGAETDPAVMADWAVEHGYWAKKSGSYLSIVPGTAESFGIHAESFTGRTPEELCSALISGKVLVALMGPGHFTKGGHFILLRGVTLTGEVLVADPNSPERSLMTWDPQLILDELSPSTSDGAPLWALSLPDPAGE